MSALAWNPRWLAWCRSLGADPQDVRAAGHRPHEFMTWNGERLREWKRETGRALGRPMTAADHDAYDAWLAAKVPA